MPLTDQLIEECVERYIREQDRYSKMAEFVYEKCQDIVRRLGVHATVQRRSKNPVSFGEKLKKKVNNYTDVQDVFSKISDLSAVRIATYLEAERNRVVEAIKKEFAGLNGSPPSVDIKDREGKLYRATHCQVYLKEDELTGVNENLQDTTCEIQVCSLLAHVFNEIEHDLVYKNLKGDPSVAEKDQLVSLANITKVGDTIIKTLFEATIARRQNNEGEFTDVYDFIYRMRPDFPNASNFSNNSEQLYDMLKKLGLSTPKKIKENINYDSNSAEIAYNWAQKLADSVNQNQDVQLEVDPLSSDQLLILLLMDNERVTCLKELYPSGRGVGRAPRFLSLSKHLQSITPSKGE